MHLDMHQGESPSLVTPTVTAQVPSLPPMAPPGAVLTLCLPKDEPGKLRQDRWSFCQGSPWWASSLLLPAQGWVLPSQSHQAQLEQQLGAVRGSFHCREQKH